MNNLIFIPDNWGYSNGGINTINMELCKSIISLKQNNICIYCLVIYCSESTVKEAKEEYGVNIISLYTKKPKRRRFESNDVYAILDKLQITDNNNGLNWVIGHDVISGEFALNLCKSLNEKIQYFNCRTAIIHHMDYEDYMVYKESYDSARITEQKSILTKADVLFAVGPRLQRSAQKIKQNENCPIIIPGMDNNGEYVQKYILSDPFRIIVCGRLDKDDDIIKNGQLTIKAIASIIKDDNRFNNTTLSLIGCSEDQKKYIQSIGEKYAGRLITVNPYNYMEHSALTREIASHSLCIMPSLREGFGLTGWEAISVGVPSIISEQSGLYELLNTPKYRGYISPMDIKGGKLNEKHDIKSLKNAIINIYNEYENSKKNSLEFRQILIDDGYTWINVAKKFLRDLSIQDLSTNKKKVSTISEAKFHYDVFTDRENFIKALFSLINQDKRVINIYGRKGIGKSSILKFFYDGINRSLSKENSNKEYYFNEHQATIDMLDVEYIELSSQSNMVDVLKKTFPQLTHENRVNVLAEFINILRTNNLNRRIIIVLDNVNNDGVREDINYLVDELLHLRDCNICIIIGSIKAQSYPQISSMYHSSLEVLPFDENDIIKYASNNNINHNKELISSVEQVTGGLPIYIKLFLKQSVNCNEKNNFTDMVMYLKNQLNIIKRDNKECYDIIVYSALFSLIFDNNHGVPIENIKRAYNEHDIFACIEKLESEYSFIDYHRSSRCIKLHDVVRDSIIKLSVKEGGRAIREVLDTLPICYKKQRCYYILLLDYSLNAKKDEEGEVVENIINAVNNEDYIFLLSLGELFTKLHNFKNYDINNCYELYSYIIWGYIEAYMGLGRYTEANDIFQNCNPLNFRVTNKSEVHLQLILTVANLKHLMNLYDDAIGDYYTILEYIKEYPNYKQYTPVCYWGIAHSMRHIGKDLNIAKEYYEKAIENGEYNTFYMLKSKSELIFIYFILSERAKAKKHIDLVAEQLKALTESKYASIRISIKRHQAICRLISGDLSDEILDILNDARTEYRRIGKRLEYDTLYEIGEFYRKKGEYDRAIKNYIESKELATINNDNNLKTMCNMAIILCEIVTERNALQQILGKSHTDILIDIIDTSKKYQMYINEQYATVILDYISGRSVTSETIDAFRQIGMIKQAKNFQKINISELEKINFFMV